MYTRSTLLLLRPRRTEVYTNLDMIRVGSTQGIDSWYLGMQHDRRQPGRRWMRFVHPMSPNQKITKDEGQLVVLRTRWRWMGIE